MPCAVHFVVPTLGRGGTERQLVYLARGLKEAGWPVAVTVLFRSGPYENHLSQAGIAFSFLNAKGLRDGRAWLRLCSLLARARPAVVHSMLFDANLWCGTALRFCAERAALVTSRRDIDQWKRPRHTWAERWASRHARAIVCNSLAAASWAASHERLPDSSYHVIYNGLPPAPGVSESQVEALRSSLRLSSGARCVLCVGTLSPKKGQDILLNAMARVRRQVMDAIALLVGEGPARENLERQAAALGLSDAIRFCGDEDDVWTYLRLASVLVVPSRYESMPNVLLEAMAAGLPVVASETGGIPEAIVQGQTGTLVPTEDTGAFADAIVRHLTDPAYAHRLARAAREIVLHRFSVTRMVEQHQTLYESIRAT